MGLTSPFIVDTSSTQALPPYGESFFVPLRLLSPHSPKHGFAGAPVCSCTLSIHASAPLGKGRWRDLPESPPKLQKTGRGKIPRPVRVFHVKHLFYSRSFFLRMTPAATMMATEMSSGGQKLPAKGSQPTFMP